MGVKGWGKYGVHGCGAGIGLSGLDLCATKPYAHVMKSSSRTTRVHDRVLRLCCLSALGLLACSGEPTPKPVSPADTDTSSSSQTEAATSDTAKQDEPAAEESDAGAPAAKAEKPKAPAKEGSGRPPILQSDPEEITSTFGSTPAAKLEIGDGDAIAVLRIPENALDRGHNITFKLEPKGKNNGGLVGKIYRTRAQVAGSQFWSKIDSAGPPFQLIFPAGNKKDANLAIGEIKVDDNDREKVTWTVVAPNKVDDATGKAFFELSWLADAYLHITTKPPTAK